MTTNQNNSAEPQVALQFENKQLHIVISGDVLNFSAEKTLEEISSILKSKPEKISFKNNKLGKWDSSLVLIIFEVIRWAKALKITYEIKELPQNLQDLVNLAFAVERKPTHIDKPQRGFIENLGYKTVNMWNISEHALNFCSSTLEALGRFVSFRSIMRRIDFLTALNECGPQALGIVALISFLVGLILAFVGAVQLQEFGAQIYVASLVTIGMCRIMGAIMVGIIMAGRTGSAYAATIGTMQVNEELDALETMGLSRMDFLVLPRILALIISMPILTMVADFMGMIGGAFVGVVLMDLPFREYWRYALDAFTLNNFLVGIFHGLCFGIIIALCGCYQGLNCGRNADSVGKSTTRSVVCSIVWMIVVTGIITILCMELGI